MFGLRLTTRRELMLFAAEIEDLRLERERLRGQVDAERKRADAAINALLIRTQKLALTPEAPTLTEEQEEARNTRVLDIFGETMQEDEVLERIQNDRS
ncbi:MAG: hypothetical protein PHE55_19960 [Methylococcaceae bacterium]|jgi:hypothetical protein|nr:hypothetical protein [Methylococcaceae bacterium]